MALLTVPPINSKASHAPTASLAPSDPNLHAVRAEFGTTVRDFRMEGRLSASGATGGLVTMVPPPIHYADGKAEAHIHANELSQKRGIDNVFGRCPGKVFLGSLADCARDAGYAAA